MPRQYYTAQDVEKSLKKKGRYPHNFVLVGHKDHLDDLINNAKNYSVKSLRSNGEMNYYKSNILSHIASHGHKEHLDKLVNDLSPYVRESVAKYGHKEHLDKLKNDKNKKVYVIAKRRLKELNKGG